MIETVVNIVTGSTSTEQSEVESLVFSIQGNTVSQSRKTRTYVSHVLSLWVVGQLTIFGVVLCSTVSSNACILITAHVPYGFTFFEITTNSFRRCTFNSCASDTFDRWIEVSHFVVKCCHVSRYSIFEVTDMVFPTKFYFETAVFNFTSVYSHSRNT